MLRIGGSTVALLAALSLLASSGTAQSATIINVTTTAQGLAADDKCSLQEAIFSANLDNNIAPHPAGQFTTACAAGSGADTIVLLPAGGTFSMTALHDHDTGNHLGATATPIVTSTIVIEGLGGRIVRSGSEPFRAFAVADTGNLTLREVHIKGFEVRGGDGGFDGGGGGLGAGGAVYVHGGSLTVEQSTFELNGALGGDGGWHTVVGTGSTGGKSAGGGGGGLGGDGGSGDNFDGGGGGGGSRGDGADGGFHGGGGGGLLADPDFVDYRAGGFPCGGDGGDGLSLSDGDGDDATCAGGGGGGGTEDLLGISDMDGGDGAYGGAGGGGACCDGDGGHGGFGGGGGGAGWAYNLTLDRFDGGTGGDGGFGGGAGAGFGGLVFGGPGARGTFAGDASGAFGGGGAGLGGAVFGHDATITVDNSTFVGNYAVRGVAGGPGADNGTDAGGAIFLVAGSLTVRNSTIGGNESTGDGAGIVVYKPTTGDSTALTLRNTIIAGNTGVRACFLRNGPTAVGSGNLIATSGPFSAPNAPCPGIAVTTDPGLEPLALSFPGRTPTMAIPLTSSAVDAADSTHALQLDQRGVLRPAGAEDIGAFEAVDPAPVTTIAFTATPDGSNGWYRSPVEIDITSADDGSVSQLRCALDPLPVPTSFADLPDAPCTLSSIESDGQHTLYAASIDANGNVESLRSATFKIDRTAPLLSPTLSSSTAQVGQAGVTALPNATDATSGVASSSCGTVDTSTVGSKTVSCTATDLAGNTLTVDFAYVVEYRILGFFEPVSVSPVQAGRVVPVKLALGDSDGNRISDAEAQALEADCRVRLSASGAQTIGPDCMRYDAEQDQFVYNWKLAKHGTGPATIEASITYPGTTATTATSTQITISS